MAVTTRERRFHIRQVLAIVDRMERRGGHNPETVTSVREAMLAELANMEHGTPAKHRDGCRCERCIDAVPHGTVNGHQYWRCRCAGCRAATAARMRQYAAVKRKTPEDAPHGTVNGYGIWGCRCDACRAAGSAANRKATLRRNPDAPLGGRQLAPCGTRSAYNRHWRRGDPPCETCGYGTRKPRAEG